MSKKEYLYYTKIKYSAIKFGIINFISAFVWASITITPAWYFGNEIIIMLKALKEYWYVLIPLAAIFFGTIIYFFKKASMKK